MLAALAVVVATMTPTLTASAQSEADKRRVDEQISSTRAQAQEASEAEAKLLTELDAASAAKRELDAKVGAIDAQISAVQRNLNAAEAHLAEAEAEQRGAEERLSRTHEELEESRRRLALYAIAAYTGQSQATQFIQTALKAGSMDELVAKRSYLKAVGNTQAEVIANDERLRDQVKDQAKELAKLTEEAAGQRDAVATERAKLQVTRDAEAAVQSEMAVAVARIDSLHDEAVARKTEFETQVRELEAQSAAIEATLRRRAEEQRAAAAAAAAAGPASAAAPTAAAVPGAGGLVNPVPGAPITSPFGYRVHPIYGDSRLHTGIDIGASEGTPIRASGGGVVVSAGWISGYGNATIVDHGGGLATLYAHQSSMAVSAGQQVSQGQVIGRVGCTGSCTGPHLHFEVRVNGAPVNPMSYI